MWGSNCKEYLKEAYRILDRGGTLFIAEPYKRWVTQQEGSEECVNRLMNWLEDSKFQIVECKENKFMVIEARKV